MKNIIKEMIEKAEYYMGIDQPDEARELLGFVRELINEMCTTYNCPSNWREIGEELAEEYKDNFFVYDGLELWGFVD